MLLLLATTAAAADVLLRNDTSDTYDSEDQVAWLEFPECAVAVLEADAADLPMDVSFVQVLFASNTGNDEGESTLAEVGLELLDDGDEPIGEMDWGFEAFTLTVSSTSLNELTLVDSASGWSALAYEAGRVAVWVCAPDPTTGEAWPRTSARDQAGILIDTQASSTGSWLAGAGSVVPLGTYVEGAWVIRAGSGDGGGGGGGGGGGDDTGSDDTGGGDGDALGVTSVTPTGTVEGQTVSLAVLGSGFADGAEVYVGGLLASNAALSGSGALSATSPSALPVGTHDVTVSLPDGGSATLPAAFTVEAAGGCGCAAPGGAPWAAWVVAALGIFRRRRVSTPA